MKSNLLDGLEKLENGIQGSLERLENKIQPFGQPGKAWKGGKVEYGHLESLEKPGKATKWNPG